MILSSLSLSHSQSFISPVTISNSKDSSSTQNSVGDDDGGIDIEPNDVGAILGDADSVSQSFGRYFAQVSLHLNFTLVFVGSPVLIQIIA